MPNLTPADLYSVDGLIKVDQKFLADVENHCPDLFQKLLDARSSASGDSSLIIELAHLLERFIAKMFKIEAEVDEGQCLNREFLALYKCKRNFVQRYATRKYPNILQINLSFSEITYALAQLLETSPSAVSEDIFVKKVNLWMEDPERYSDSLDIAAQYAVHMVHSGGGSLLFQVPKQYDKDNLVPLEKKDLVDGFPVHTASRKILKQRTGFATAKTPTAYQALNEVHYCIFCHKQKRDSCSRGMVDRDGSIKRSGLNVPMIGCPLKVKVSETNLLKSQGLVIAPLAVIAIDNPMCVMTGHRICNDCTRACIYQKQQQVDVPSIETHVLDSVLNLPYGFEIYSLFTRWNPLSFSNTLPKQPTGKNVLVVGLGPAGIGISHYLLNEGHNVIAVDGLKIDPLPVHLSGVSRSSEKTSFTLIKNAKTEIFENLEERLSYGFGGVSEYGITARWNKNYLKVARMLLERRYHFAAYGGIRLGSTLSTQDAFSMGFHHIALATGAGGPKIPMCKNMLAKGVMTASSFLMALHLGNAPHKSSISGLQIRFPAVVVGGGLTAVDAATELLAYYPIQVERFLERYEELSQNCYQGTLEGDWTEEEVEIFGEFLTHARQIRHEKELATREGRAPRILELLQKWGGVTIVYRSGLNSSTAYRLNSDELTHAMSEGIYFAENLQLDEILVNKYKSAVGIQVIDRNNGKRFVPAKCVVIAIGTNENSVTLEESRAHSREFQCGCAASDLILDENSFYLSSEKTISAFGDIHPYYKGSVVKALASAKNGYLGISQALEQCESSSNNEEFFAKITQLFGAKVVAATKLADKIMEIRIHAPLAAANFKPGQFYRMQSIGRDNYLDMDMECVAVTGTSVDREEGTVSVVVLDVGVSSRLCNNLQPGQLVSLMGPTGSPTYIPTAENVMLIGGGVGNAALFSIGESMMSHGCKVLFFAGFKTQSSVFGTQQVKAASNAAVWCCEKGVVALSRSQDLFYQGNVIEAITEYSQDCRAKIKLDSIDRVIMVGSSGMMSAIKNCMTGKLKSAFKEDIRLIASINSPMQCMMKEICGQCIQRHVDPGTGEESFLYSCVNQDQCARRVDFDFLRNRLAQNSVLEKSTSLWVNHCIENAKEGC
ncbi:dihydroorotate dehydrogenase B (NAD(+)), electron transfer subunit [Anaplasma platys]|uniref:Dihydroorotate dehydrogenase B (NAD(+)), electron transfer subunit n=1 Tax=Anaplasma platys TaxID=949 RepID=A0A858PY53_9RICK|nr:FAD-dependent oxidoreductase [Anaplasma platys]QJC27504.1 dihydroorotate dehydrogenase B (NAD(+)), electron transfer subunit [Anaplasma platys]